MCRSSCFAFISLFVLRSASAGCAPSAADPIPPDHLRELPTSSLPQRCPRAIPQPPHSRQAAGGSPNCSSSRRAPSVGSPGKRGARL